jgi:hypothetical protein
VPLQGTHNNWVENQICPWAVGRPNWLFAGSLRGGQRAAAIMSLIQSARLNGHDPYAYLKDVLTRLPTQKNNRSTSCCPIVGDRLADPLRQAVIAGRLLREVAHERSIRLLEAAYRFT